jgi:hypothetical protein
LLLTLTASPAFSGNGAHRFAAGFVQGQIVAGQQFGFTPRNLG